jgi:hypothetical protein
MEQSQFVQILVFSPDYGPRDESGWVRVEPGRMEFSDSLVVGSGETLVFEVPQIVFEIPPFG